MNLFHSFTKPYYLYRPSQIWRRLRFEFENSSMPRWVTLPWGLRMWANADDDLGHALLTTGVNDLVTSECLFRMTESGELAVDVGANVGYTTSILCVRAQSSGQVTSFEPHPTLYQELHTHFTSWKTQCADLAKVNLVNRAVSEGIGEAALNEPASFASNKGRSTLQLQDTAIKDGRELRVATVSLDTHFAGNEAIGVLKVDVEGHEEQVFAGAKNILSTGRVRDVIFEEFAPYPAATHQILEGYGYQIFVVEEYVVGPILVLPSPEWKPPLCSPPNYVATRDVEQLRRKFKPRGWQCLSQKACETPTASRSG